MKRKIYLAHLRNNINKKFNYNFLTNNNIMINSGLNYKSIYKINKMIKLFNYLKIKRELFFAHYFKVIKTLSQKYSRTYKK